MPKAHIYYYMMSHRCCRFWASLEHQLHYKNDADVPDSIRRELFRVAETIAMTDREMEEIAIELQALD